MAAVQSTGSGSISNGNLVITAPTGITVGDLLVAYLFGGANNTFSPPSGWTAIRNDTVAIYVWQSYYKIADSGDAAASNFTFQNPGTNFAAVGWICRITNFDATTPINTSNGVASTSAGTTVSGAAVTPSKGSALFMFAGRASNAARTFSGYVVANSDPGTWVEGFDQDLVLGSDHYSGAVGYAFRTGVTSTGNATVTLSATSSVKNIQLIAINNEVVRPSPLTMTFTLNQITIPVVIVNVLNMVFTLVSPTVTAMTAKWRNPDKNSSNWVNPDKS